MTKRLGCHFSLTHTRPPYARVREVAEHSLNGLAEALRGADFSTLEAAHEQVRELDREAERSVEQERDISRDRDDGFSL